MEDIHNRSITAVTAIAWPFYGFFALYPLESLRFLFGPQWDDAAPLVPIFCAAGAVAVVWSLGMNMITAMGKVKLATLSELIIQPLRIVILVLVALAFDEIMPLLFTVNQCLYIQAFCMPNTLENARSGANLLRNTDCLELEPGLYHISTFP